MGRRIDLFERPNWPTKIRAADIETVRFGNNGEIKSIDGTLLGKKAGRDITSSFAFLQGLVSIKNQSRFGLNEDQLDVLRADITDMVRTLIGRKTVLDHLLENPIVFKSLGIIALGVFLLIAFRTGC